jgi:hypothetical protein
MVGELNKIWFDVTPESQSSCSGWWWLVSVLGEFGMLARQALGRHVVMRPKPHDIHFYKWQRRSHGVHGAGECRAWNGSDGSVGPDSSGDCVTASG